MIRFIEAHKGHHGVERICRVLAGTPGGFLSVAGYYAARRRAPSARAVRDAELVDVVRRVHAVNYSVYGVRKMQAALAREGVVVGRDQTRRLMRLAGVRGVHRGTFRRTTVSDPAATRPADLVNRNFHPGRPDALWVADITYIRTWSGWAYLALVIDAHSRRVLGWALAAHLRTELPLEALNMAFWTRGRTNADLVGLVAHTDAGTQYTSLRYTERLVEGGALASIGSVGDSYDERDGRVHHRADQDRADRATRAVANPRRPRARAVRVPRLVEPPPAARRTRHAHPRGGRARTRTTCPPRRGGHPMKTASTKPRPLHCVDQRTTPPSVESASAGQRRWS